MAKIISVIQLKGGSGKSTLSTNLVGALAMRGLKVGLIDADQPQNTSGSWAAIRHAAMPLLEGHQLLLHRPKDAKELIQAARAMDAAADWIVIDLPPRLHEISRAALMLSDLAIMPVSPSAAELWAVQDMLELIARAKEKKPDLRALLLWNKYRPSKAATAAIEALEQMGLDRLDSTLSQRQAYSDALGRGLTVLEGTDTKAKQELEALLKEIQEKTA